ncbi:MAG: LytR C-terminal domain-containing protein [Propionibacteriaceae bacterium]|nr:LytR C-terminal domain-containing protein [Propionibacteriaceae bacterium]
MRVFRLIATPVLLLGLLGFLAWGASWGWQNLTAPAPSPPPTPCVNQSLNAVTASNVSVRVFNGGFQAGLATRVGEALKAAGFHVIRITNTEERINTTTIRTGDNNVEAGTLVGSYLNEPTAETDTRVDGTVDVLVGSDFKGLTDAGLPEVAVESGTICLYPITEPSAQPS